MSDTIIAVENLSKRYLIEHRPGAQGHKIYIALREVIEQQARNLARKALAAAWQRPTSPTREVEEFWALKDVSFEVKQGDVLGIIGRNGAGKSTLLKILSRITEPTAGRVTLRGRVASLLEVGTGFHPELTGRENIYLNGAILGMSRAEIRRKFDEIVAFAETEKFLDTPVKRYSSGMYVRLAFAVAAHLEPEILVVDEVLAVGDAEFQKKCLGKMDDVSRREGRTVLFVSHNMSIISNLCPNAIWLDRGSVCWLGRTGEVIKEYMAHGISKNGAVARLTHLPRPWIEGNELRLQSLEWLCDLPLKHGESVNLRVSFLTNTPVSNIAITITFCDLTGKRLLTYDTNLPERYQPTLAEPGIYMVELAIDALPLQPDTYMLDIGSRSGNFWVLDHISAALQMEVLAGPTTPSFIARMSHMPHVRLNSKSTWHPGSPITTSTYGETSRTLLSHTKVA